MITKTSTGNGLLYERQSHFCSMGGPYGRYPFLETNLTPGKHTKWEGG